MAKYSDNKSAGRSDRVPFIEGESAQDRHWRRLGANLAMRDELIKWCQQWGVKVKISNEGQHWQFRLGLHTAHWWPSSAKCVFHLAWTRSIHVHDCEQMKALLVKRWGLDSSTENAEREA